MNGFLAGALVAISLAIALFFLRFWVQQRDRLFLFFAVAFTALAAEWGIAAVLAADNPAKPYVYVVRLLAFVVILAGVIDKNRR